MTVRVILFISRYCFYSIKNVSHFVFFCRGEKIKMSRPKRLNTV